MRHEQLKLVTLALWRLLKDRVGLTEAELKRYVESTDLLDGAADGKVDLTRELVKCSRCSRCRAKYRDRLSVLRHSREVGEVCLTPRERNFCRVC